MKTYTAPVSSLLSVGIPVNWTFDEFPLLEAGIRHEHVPALLELASDDQLLSLNEDIPEIWGPIHAWCALGQLKAVEAIEPLQQLLIRQTEDTFLDWFFEYLPFVIAELGPEIIAPMGAVLADRTVYLSCRSIAAQALNELGYNDVGQRQACVEALVVPLRTPEFDDPSLLGFVVAELLSLHATEAAEVIEQAFAGGFVDESIVGNWKDVKFELEYGRRPRKRLDRVPHGVKPQCGTPEARKARNKARKKLEKKSSRRK